MNQKTIVIYTLMVIIAMVAAIVYQAIYDWWNKRRKQ